MNEPEQLQDQEPSGDPSGEKSAGQRKGTEKTEYVVYVAAGTVSKKSGAHEELRAIWFGQAEDESAARWAAVDARPEPDDEGDSTDEYDVRARAGGNGPELHLLALPKSRAQARLTKELVETKKVRK